MSNLQVIKKILSNPCYCCSVVGGKPISKKECKTCNGTGIYKENFYYHLYKDKSGQLIAIDGDSVK